MVELRLEKIGRCPSKTLFARSEIPALGLQRLFPRTLVFVNVNGMPTRIPSVGNLYSIAIPDSRSRDSRARFDNWSLLSAISKSGFFPGRWAFSLGRDPTDEFSEPFLMVVNVGASVVANLRHMEAKAS